MTQEYLQLGATAIVAITAFKAIEYIVKILKPKNGNVDNKQDDRIIKIETLFSEHCKVQSESFATIHNGLNSTAKTIKELTDKLAENTQAIAVLTTIINERIPKKHLED